MIRNGYRSQFVLEKQPNVVHFGLSLYLTDYWFSTFIFSKATLPISMMHGK